MKDTNPDIITIKLVYEEIKDLRKENKTDHTILAIEQIKQGKDIACLQTKWRFLRWLVPASVTAAVAIVGLAYKFLG